MSGKENVTNIFKDGCKPTKEAYTKLWIDLINRLERSR